MGKVIELKQYSESLNDAILEIMGSQLSTIHEIETAALIASMELADGSGLTEAIDSAARCLDMLRWKRVKQEMAERNKANLKRYQALRNPKLSELGKVAIVLRHITNEREYWPTVAKAARVLKGGGTPERAVLLSMGVDMEVEHARS